MPGNGYANLDPAFSGDIDRDVLILVIGDGGVGKSYFLNRLLGAIGHISPEDVLEEGATQDNCTLGIRPIVVEEHGWIQRYLYITINPSPTRFILVDTPALDADPNDQRAGVRRVADWVKRSYPSALTETQTLIGGVVYLHDISKDRIPETTYQNLLLLRNLLPEHFLDWSSVVLLTAKWGRGEESDLISKEATLKAKHWRMLLKSESNKPGANVARLSAGPLEDERNSALEIVQPLVKRFDQWRGSATLDVWTHVQGYCAGKRIRSPAFTESLNSAIQDIIEALNRVSAAEAALEGGSTLLDVDVGGLEVGWRESYEVLEELQSQISAWDKVLLYLQALSPRLWAQRNSSTPSPSAKN